MNTRFHPTISSDILQKFKTICKEKKRGTPGDRIARFMELDIEYLSNDLDILDLIKLKVI